jgi:hypothetical protein
VKLIVLILEGFNILCVAFQKFLRSFCIGVLLLELLDKLVASFLESVVQFAAGRTGLALTVTQRPSFVKIHHLLISRRRDLLGVAMHSSFLMSPHVVLRFVRHSG